MSDKPIRGRGRPVLTSPEEVKKHKKRLKYSDEDLSMELGVTVAEAIAYQTGTAEMPDTVKESFLLLKKKTTRKNKPRKAVAVTT